MTQIFSLKDTCCLRTDATLFYMLIVALLIPIWTTVYIPTQDGPLHLANAVTLVNLLDPGWETASKYYELNALLFPTWLVPLILGWLSQVVSPLLAEKLLLTLYVVGLPISFCFAIRPLTETPHLGGLLVLPLVLNYPLHMGFYAFLLGVVLLLLAIGVWLRSQRQLPVSILITACLISYLLFHVHPFSWVMMALALGCMELAEYFKKLRSRLSWTERMTTAMKFLSQRWRLYLLTFVPGMFHTAIFLNLQNSTPSSIMSKVNEKLATSDAALGFVSKRFEILIDRIVGFLSLSSLVSFDRVEMVLSIGFMGSVILLTYLTLRSTTHSIEGRPRDCLLFVALSYITFYFVTKDHMVGGGFVACRVQLLAILLYVAWLASSSILQCFRILTICLSLFLVGFSTLYYTFTYHEFGRAIDRVVTMANHISKGSTIMPVVLPDLEKAPVILANITPNPMLHSEGHIVYRRRVVDFGNYQGWKGYFPLRFRSEYNPMQHIAIDGKIELNNNYRLPELNLSIPYDGKLVINYVIIVGCINDFREHPEIRSLLSQLDQFYEIVIGDSGAPPMVLFRHKESEQTKSLYR